jgi:hypothetical protein
LLRRVGGNTYIIPVGNNELTEPILKKKSVPKPNNVVFPSKQRNTVHPSIQYNRRLLENKQTENYNDRQAFQGYIVELTNNKVINALMQR